MKGPAPATKTETEIAEAVDGLESADWARLRLVAQSYARSYGGEAKDLLQTAFLRALEGTRKCPVDVDVVRFLAEAMRSIAHAEVEKLRLRAQFTLVAKDGEKLDEPEARARELNPEQAVIAAESCVQMRDEILKIFDNDLVAVTMVEGIMEGMRGEELRSTVDLDQKSFETKRKFILRRVRKHKGSQP